MYFRNITSLVLFMALVSMQSMKASHYMGGEISYEHISGNDYKIRLKIIRDCSGVPLGTTMPIEISSPGSPSTSITSHKSVFHGCHPALSWSAISMHIV
jgi:hypothetical protein